MASLGSRNDEVAYSCGRGGSHNADVAGGPHIADVVILGFNLGFIVAFEGNYKDVGELSNFLGTIARDNVSLTYVNWHVVPDQLKQKLWEYTLARFDIHEDGRKWVYTTLSVAWKLHKARVKKAYYTKNDNVEERLENRPDRVPLEDFKMLLKYWGDAKVQKIGRDNAESRKSLLETHTLGRKPVALVIEKLKKDDPNLEHPSDAQINSLTRKRDKGREYKSDTDKMKKKLEKIEKLIEQGKEDEANAIASNGKDHGPN
ncbi:hypothetical protein DCAR_0205717 [Daucus carota subsp. sativus]|uniref:Uncharacterized protein n=1 Tax=Daucus carota subsp. sativus TaxID=79200 RepID=A0AAF1AND2_DAUCS|nr:PREDICTED: uncharacterized protein LOC108203260 [Daucus carota subsp. sativus]WOG86506.1 hypothetical protein DCAR_0205717 [Daucus carota subsp. sativus]